MSEGMSDSMESLSSLPALQQHRASLTHPRLLGRDSMSDSSGRISRSNSIRSTKSEKLYLQRNEDGDPYYTMPLGTSPSAQHLPHHHSSQPTSPTAGQLAQGTSRSVVLTQYQPLAYHLFCQHS